MLEDLGRSLAAQGFRDVLVSNFHGSPRHFLSIEVACDRVARERGIRMLCIFSALLSRLNGGGSELGDVLGHLEGVEKADFEGDTHGGLVETSQLLALHPEWVDPGFKELPRRSVDLWLEERGEARPKAQRGKLASLGDMLASFRAGIRFFSEETYSGAPAKASAELGERILDTLAGHAAAAGDAAPGRRAAGGGMALAAVEAPARLRESGGGAPRRRLASGPAHGELSAGARFA